MYPGGIAGVAGGTLAATGLAVTGYLWAAAVIISVGLALVALGVVRDRRIVARSHGG